MAGPDYFGAAVIIDGGYAITSWTSDEGNCVFAASTGQGIISISNAHARYCESSCASHDSLPYHVDLVLAQIRRVGVGGREVGQ